MSRHIRTTIRYDGPALADHEMDVQDLAPALLALADIIQVANKKFNGGDADIKVLVNADVKQRCFMIDISLVQSLLDQAKGFLGSDHIKTAREIAEWIGIIGGGTASFFELLKFINILKSSDVIPNITQHGTANVAITGNGNTLIVRNEVYLLTQEPRAVEKAQAVVRPLRKVGYDSLAFMEGDSEVFEVNKAEAEGIMALPTQPLEQAARESISTIQGQVRIKSAQYEGSAQWSFLWSGRAINAEMVDAAAEWVADFQQNKVHAPPNSILDVTMTETAQLDRDGLAVGKPTYKVLKVHRVIPPPTQLPLIAD